MYNYGIDYNTISAPATSTGSAVWIIVSVILSIIGGIVIYFLFVNPKKNQKSKYLIWIKEFLQFKKMFIETILKVTYIILALFVTLSSFALIGSNFLGFLLTLIFGNLLLRITYEFSIILIMIWKNTSEINEKQNKKQSSKEV